MPGRFTIVFFHPVCPVDPVGVFLYSLIQKVQAEEEEAPAAQLGRSNGLKIESNAHA